MTQQQKQDDQGFMAFVVIGTFWFGLIGYVALKLYLQSLGISI